MITKRILQYRRAAVFGHDRPLKNEELKMDWITSPGNFDDIILPSHGRYVDDKKWVTGFKK